MPDLEWSNKRQTGIFAGAQRYAEEQGWESPRANTENDGRWNADRDQRRMTPPQRRRLLDHPGGRRSRLAQPLQNGKNGWNQDQDNQ